jgi:hypothetical protein
MHRTSVERISGGSVMPTARVLESAIARAPTLVALRSTRELYLSNRKLLTLRGLVERTQNLEALWVNGNALSSLEGLERLAALRSLFAHDNPLEDLADSLRSCSCLQELTLHNCRLPDLTRILASIEHLENLRLLSLHGNPAANEADYRLQVIARLPALAVLDDCSVTPAERERARLIFPTTADNSSGSRGRRKRAEAALAFGTRGRSGTCLRATSRASPGPRGEQTASVAERVRATASRVRHRQLTEELAATFSSFSSASNNRTADSAGAHGTPASALLSALETVEGPVAPAVRASMVSRGVTQNALLPTSATWSNPDGTTARDAMCLSLVPHPLHGRETGLMVSAAPRAQLSACGAVSDATTAPAPSQAASPQPRLDAAGVRRLVMERTGVRLHAPSSMLSTLGSAPTYGGGSGVLSISFGDGYLGAWDKLRLLRLLSNGAAGACVSGQQLISAVKAMADFGCVAVPPVTAGATSSSDCGGGAVEQDDEAAEAFLRSQMLRMDPFGSDKFGAREFVDSLDSGVYQVLLSRSSS